jgi:hypothetical protein
MSVSAAMDLLQQKWRTYSLVCLFVECTLDLYLGLVDRLLCNGGSHDVYGIAAAAASILSC